MHSTSIIMTKVRSSKNKQIITRTLDDSDNEDDQLVIRTSQTYSQSTLVCSENPNINSSTLASNMDNSNEIDADLDTPAKTSSLDQPVVGQKLVSKVWLYATKLNGGEQAACQLCDFKC